MALSCHGQLSISGDLRKGFRRERSEDSRTVQAEVAAVVEVRRGQPYFGKGAHSVYDLQAIGRVLSSTELDKDAEGALCDGETQAPVLCLAQRFF